MKIIKPDVQFITPIDGATILKRLEQCGRVCYKSEDKITEGSAEKFVAGIIKRGHEAVLEHCSFTVKFICDRGVSHEIVRHRMASYCQESTRYCNYGKGKFGEEITVIEPCFLNEQTAHIWKRACEATETAYFDLLAEGCSPQEARSVLPNSLKTEVVMTANIREWRHFLKLRCSPAAHPQMREVALILLDKVHWLIPVCFDDIWSEYHADVKKSGGKIFAVQFNKAEEKALNQAINEQIVANDRAFDMDKESSILWMLHTQFGFGPKRLKLAWKLFYAETLKLREYYLMDQEDDGWLARQKLKDIGCDIEEWYREEGGKTDA
jgi:thymidylate synthase (FAD)